MVLLSLLGCDAYEWLTGTVTETVATQGIEALDNAREQVKAAESSPGKRRVMRVIRKLKSEIDAGEHSGFNGNLFAAAVEEVAKDGVISNTEAGVVEDAYQRILDGDLSRRRKAKRKAEDAEPSPDKSAIEDH